MNNFQPYQDRRLTFAFAGTILLSAFLLFLIQPMISKYILPWFGGGTAVWTTAMMFFQVILLGGYLYAHWLSSLGPHRQALLHALVIASAGGWLLISGWVWGTPLLAGSALRPPSADLPVWYVLRVLFLSVGLPYFLLSTTSTLLQYWFGRIFRSGQPYGFYILSNGASLLALLSYPFVFEPLLPLKSQAFIWAAGFAVFLVFLAASMRGALSANWSLAKTDISQEPVAVPEWRSMLVWVFLAACASVVLLAGTNELTQDIASVPFLWVLPLSLYLLTFMLGFSDRVRLPTSLLIGLNLVSLGLAIWAQTKIGEQAIPMQVFINAAVVFFACLLCHSEVYARRPNPRHLTVFYLMISVGGALGGIFVNLVAPVIFEGYWEYHISLALVAFTAIGILYTRKDVWLRRLRIPVAVIGLAGVVFILSFPIYIQRGSLLMERNFYGVVRVRQGFIDGMETYRMVHGSTMHGLQAFDPNYRLKPTTYYTSQSGIGLAMQVLPNRVNLRPVRVGLIGLGIGTLAVYGNAGDVFRFYELDPAVIRLAEGKYFSYLRDTRATVELVAGDARVSLERELKQGGQGYDLLVVDAFSGDSIPVHLLTKEAMELYLAHLNPNGMVAIHISNKHVDLQPVLGRLKESLGLAGMFIDGLGSRPLGLQSWWVLLARNPAVLSSPTLAAVKKEIRIDPRIRLWTDDYSNLFQVLR
jgi:hypothetical protein